MKTPKTVDIVDGKKKCSNCKEIKSVYKFYNSASSSSGKRSTCIDCDNDYKNSKTEEYKAYKAKWYQENKNKKSYKKKRIKNDSNFRKSNKGRFNSLRNSAKSRKLTLDITYEQYLNLIENFNCFYCKTTEISKTGHQLDRVNNDKGYSIENVVVCCTRCNYIKQDLVSFEEMILIGKAIQEYRNNG